LNGTIRDEMGRRLAPRGANAEIVVKKAIDKREWRYIIANISKIGNIREKYLQKVANTSF